MDDLISRQAAVDALCELYEYQRAFDPTEAADLVRQGIYLAEKKIEQLPSAEPKRKNGEWIEDGYNNYKAVCSECGEPCGTYVMDKPRDNFCKWCGSDMRGEQDE